MGGKGTREDGQTTVNECSTSDSPARESKTRAWEAWDSKAVHLFFSALRQHGKDFDAIQQHIAQKSKTNLKNVVQVRNFYYNSCGKISRLLDLSESSAPKEAKELFSLIAYGEWHKKLPHVKIEGRNTKQFNQLVLKGKVTVKVSPKYGSKPCRSRVKIAIPACPALKKICKLVQRPNGGSADDGVQSSEKVVLVLKPRCGDVEVYVNGCQRSGPYMRIVNALDHPLRAILELVSDDWKLPKCSLADPPQHGAKTDAPRTISADENHAFGLDRFFSRTSADVVSEQSGSAYADSEPVADAADQQCHFNVVEYDKAFPTAAMHVTPDKFASIARIKNSCPVKPGCIWLKAHCSSEIFFEYKLYARNVRENFEEFLLPKLEQVLNESTFESVPFVDDEHPANKGCVAATLEPVISICQNALNMGQPIVPYDCWQTDQKMHGWNDVASGLPASSDAAFQPPWPVSQSAINCLPTTQQNNRPEIPPLGFIQCYPAEPVDVVGCPAVTTQCYVDGPCAAANGFDEHVDAKLSNGADLPKPLLTSLSTPAQHVSSTCVDEVVSFMNNFYSFKSRRGVNKTSNYTGGNWEPSTVATTVLSRMQDSTAECSRIVRPSCSPSDGDTFVQTYAIVAEQSPCLEHTETIVAPSVQPSFSCPKEQSTPDDQCPVADSENRSFIEDFFDVQLPTTSSMLWGDGTKNKDQDECGLTDFQGVQLQGP